MTTTIFTEILRALDASIGVQGGDILSYVHNCAFCQQDMSVLHHINYMHYPPVFLS
jgi:hypothetical protein